MLTRTCEACGVRERALCGVLDDAALAELAVLGVQRRLGRGETLLHAGDPPLVCANVQSGALKIVSLSSDGDDAIVGLLYPGDFVGSPYADRTTHDVVALSDATLCVFPRSVFERALADHRRMEQLLLQRTLGDLAATRDRLAALARASAGSRVAGFLADAARRLAVAGCQRGLEPETTSFDLPLSRGEIGDLLGLTIETVSRQMTRLRLAGIIDLPGGRGIVVRDAAGLLAAAA